MGFNAIGINQVQVIFELRFGVKTDVMNSNCKFYFLKKIWSKYHPKSKNMGDIFKRVKDTYFVCCSFIKYFNFFLCSTIFHSIYTIFKGIIVEVFLFLTYKWDTLVELKLWLMDSYLKALWIHGVLSSLLFQKRFFLENFLSSDGL